MGSDVISRVYVRVCLAFKLVALTTHFSYLIISIKHVKTTLKIFCSNEPVKTNWKFF